MHSQEMIEIISNFVLSTEFFYWLAKDDLMYKSLHETICFDLYEYVGECHIQNHHVFTIWGSFFLNKVHENFYHLLNKAKMRSCPLLPELKKLEKKGVSYIETESTYTVISEFFYRGQRCGNCWEIFELSNLMEIYTSKVPSLTLSS